MNTAYLHVGLHKTGTTSVQEFFENENSIIFNPECLWCWDERNKIHVVENISTYTEDVFFSYEQLSWLTQDQIAGLKNLLYETFNQVKILLFYRDPVSLAISHKNQSVKELAPGSFFERDMYGISYDILPKNKPSYVNIRLHIEKWEVIFGAEHVCALSFESHIGKKMINEISNFIGVDTSDDKTLDNRNKKLNYTQFILSSHAFKKFDAGLITLQDTKKVLENIKRLQPEKNISPSFQKYDWVESNDMGDEITVSLGLLNILDSFSNLLVSTPVMNKQNIVDINFAAGLVAKTNPELSKRLIAITRNFSD
jgi:hypothetical protein